MSTIARIPAYLKPYVVDQDYERYTPRDQATWRFIMTMAQDFFKVHAHPVYLEGLEKTGIPIDHIPRIEDMDRVLNKFGWGAVCIRGFIPPLAFLDFQANRILPIAADIRSPEHLGYTPAPDIVHEAAGHAPILADKDFSEYLMAYAQIARKAIYSSDDIKLYEAIRCLSDLKENPDATEQQIANAQEQLNKAQKAVTWVSEATQISRMNWWTAEYGLIGSLENPRIYGAGLLSSLEESETCLRAHVKKIPFTGECIKQGYDITEPQPQLYVVDHFKTLTRELHVLEETMAFKRGGIYGLTTAQKSKAMTTLVLNSGLQVSGILDSYLAPNEALVFVKWSGEVQLCLAGKELPGHGKERHGSGFSSPFGPWKGESTAPFKFKPKDLEKRNLFVGQDCTIEYESGFKVEGRLKGIHYKNGQLLLLTFSDCTVSLAGEKYFLPEWGEFDLALGTEVASVYGGPGDWVALGEHELGKASTVPGRTSPFTPKEQALFRKYKDLRGVKKGESSMKVVQEIAADFLDEFPHEWLLGYEIVAGAAVSGMSLKDYPEVQRVYKALCDSRRWDEDQFHYIQKGLSKILGSSPSLIL